MMPTDPIPTPITGMATMLQHLQQGLLRQGYTYVDGDEATWPLSNVLMVKDGCLLLVAVGAPEQFPFLTAAFRELTRQHPHAGLLVVGAEPPDAPLVSALFQSLADTAVVYLNAATQQMRRNIPTDAPFRVPDALNEPVLMWLLHPPQWADNAAIDCRQALVEQKRLFAERPRVDADTPRRMPPLTLALIVLCVAMFLVSLGRAGLGGLWDMPTAALKPLGLLWAPYVYHGQWWRLIAAGFLHGNLLHLGMNMFALYVLGALLEQWQGWPRMGTVFLYTVITSSLVSLLLLPAVSSVGASGGIFGLLGFVAAILIRHGRDMAPPMRTGLVNWLKTVLPINIVISFMHGINWAGHLGGFLGGLLLGIIVARLPFRSARLAGWEWALVAALCIATAVLGIMTITHLPDAFAAARSGGR